MSDDIPTLTEMVAGLEPRLRQTLRHIVVELRDDEATVRLNFALFTRRSVEMSANAALTATEHWPDRTRALSTATPIEQQIADLEASGQVGGIDAARYQGAGLRWHIATQAGSDAEHAAWRNAL